MSIAEDEFGGIPPQERPGPVIRLREGQVGIGDKIFGAVSASMAILVLVVLSGAALAMLWGGLLAFKTFGFPFIYSSDWDAVNLKFGAFVPIYGTLVTSAIAIVIAVPISFGISIFLTELAPRWLRGPVSTAIELLAAVPSIIYGMWGLFVFVPFISTNIEPWLNDHVGTLPVIGPLFAGPPIGIGMLTAGVILAIMIIPFITAVMRDVFNAVPRELKESARALGSTTWEVVSHVSLPYTRTAVVGAIFLGLGRALGETMAVTFVLGNAHDFSVSLLMPGNSIAAAIANEFTEADSPIYVSSLIALAFLLFVVTFIVLALAKLMLARIGRLEGAKA
jgi:phosphate transport system permease protein